MDGVNLSFIREADESNRGHNRELLASILSFVNAHFMEWSMSLTLLSEQFNLTEQYLSTFFREQTGGFQSRGRANGQMQPRRVPEAPRALACHRGTV